MVAIDFTSKSFLYKLQQGKWKSSLLAKALGIKHGTNYCIIDATAGFGEDGLVMASLGYDVTMVERQPQMFEALTTALVAAQSHSDLNEIVAHMKLINADSIDFLATPQQADIIYLDPMFPHSKKTAQVNKNMQIARELIGEDLDADQLLTNALAQNVARVVVKRPAKAPSINDQTPTHQIEGKSNRYDVYVKRSLKAD